MVCERLKEELELYFNGHQTEQRTLEKIFVIVNRGCPYYKELRELRAHLKIGGSC